MECGQLGQEGPSGFFLSTPVQVAEQEQVALALGPLFLSGCNYVGIVLFEATTLSITCTCFAGEYVASNNMAHDTPFEAILATAHPFAPFEAMRIV